MLRNDVGDTELFKGEAVNLVGKGAVSLRVVMAKRGPLGACARAPQLSSWCSDSSVSKRQLPEGVGY